MTQWFERLTASGVQQCFSQAQARVWTPEKFEDRVSTGLPPMQAAVLIPLVQRTQGLSALLTLRTGHLNAHAGQVSFPGGRFEPCDTNLVNTALREAWEEIGLSPTHVTVLGCLPVYHTASDFLVTPVVGLLAPGFSVQADGTEVAEIFEVPLSFLMNPAHHQRRVLQTATGSRNFYAMQYDAPDANKSYLIWGATAAMIRNLCHFLNPEA